MSDARLPGISVVTLGVADVERSERFYRNGFGLEYARPPKGVVYFELTGTLLALYPRDALARYAGVEPGPFPGGFRVRRSHATSRRAPRSRRSPRGRRRQARR